MLRGTDADGAVQHMARAARKVPVKAIIVSIDGKILSDEWI